MLPTNLRRSITRYHPVNEGKSNNRTPIAGIGYRQRATARPICDVRDQPISDIHFRQGYSSTRLVNYE
jgi:hypothetical protein